jgi:uncharacterized protein YciI
MKQLLTISNHAILSAEERAMLAQSVIAVEQKSITQVASETGLHPDILSALVRDGVLAGLPPTRDADGVCDVDAAREIAEQLAAARAPVEGQPIVATDAAEKYSFPPQTIYKWHASGWVKKLGGEKRNRLFNEGDIAFARALADLRGQAEGKAVFPAKPRSGRPRKQ